MSILLRGFLSLKNWVSRMGISQTSCWELISGGDGLQDPKHVFFINQVINAYFRIPRPFDFHLISNVVSLLID